MEALGMTLPVGSVTLPAIVPVVVCPIALYPAVIPTSAITIKTRVRALWLLQIMLSPFL
jgi:hypothetical protein